MWLSLRKCKISAVRYTGTEVGDLSLLRKSPTKGSSSFMSPVHSENKIFTGWSDKMAVVVASLPQP
jgi:hypothetical protein